MSHTFACCVSAASMEPLPQPRSYQVACYPLMEQSAEGQPASDGVVAVGDSAGEAAGETTQ